ncbi:MAG TPA: HAMP domain-containing sensor histidine kinase, partial [Longimicrobiaceae bacterium]|nr:HAMP domain-containing sensor histidine kinase [Longimicrobiaceae bacterium]
ALAAAAAGAREPAWLADEEADAEEGGALALPVEAGGEPAGAVVLKAPAATGLVRDPAAWRGVAAALARVHERDRALRQAQEERDTLRQRAEESEALHVLGLAANRTLDPDEVLTLVARFTRTLLGAHYVTVNTVAEGSLRTVASVGLRTPAAEAGDDPFAARVAAARKPLTLYADAATGEVSEPFHAAEGMRVGLGVPLSLFGETFGALVVGYRRAYDLAPRDTRLALTLAGHAAVAISNARLHGALAERSGELERANEELRWSTEAKDRFFASVSHELRTPLNAILGYQTLLLDGVTGELPSTVRPFLEKAHRATQNLLHLVNDVLDLSKLDAGKMELVVQPVRIRAIVEEAVATVEPMAVGKGIEVEMPAPPALPLVATDADRVRQILVNLLSNAVKFTDEGKVTIQVVADGPGDERGRWLELRVADTGPGIAPENRERIFHEFEQILGATARGGTGLGLPIARRLARLLGGDILVESRLGAGSTFTLRLPLREA